METLQLGIYKLLELVELRLSDHVYICHPIIDTDSRLCIVFLGLLDFRFFN